MHGRNWLGEVGGGGREREGQVNVKRLLDETLRTTAPWSGLCDASVLLLKFVQALLTFARLIHPFR